ncbi:hypothetical protein OWR29_15515 [Actinoplanes sp. Pm04-4]|uniref:Uncharacterized protein n=1 Tax=Paractinoplanes pyxinae TaxID=2997416 RepID=A0ABT4AZY1_9ACTN|nr:hypothetical protein [Actinoplanes pyxinae]MCY1139407.1 hypothetical protein [Actinoplanes pyxinae]
MALIAFWFPLRLWLDHGDPILAILANSGLYGAIWGLFPWLIDKVNKQGRRALTTADRRRGITIGLAVGVPVFGAFLALCLATGRWVHAGLFALTLAGLVAAAWMSHRALKSGDDRAVAARG